MTKSYRDEGVSIVAKNRRAKHNLNFLEKALKQLLAAKLFLLLPLLALTLSSCLDNQPNSRDRSSSPSSTPEPSEEAPSPDFGNALNFLQNGSTQSSSSINLPMGQEDFFYLRGKEIDAYLRSQGNDGHVICLVSYFPTSQQNKILVSSLSPQSFYNFSTSEKENYYLVNAISEETTKGFCQKPGLMAELDDLYPGESVAWEISKLCHNANCNSSNYSSQPLRIMSAAGHEIDLIDVSYLSLRLNNTSSGGSSSGQSCDSSSQCRSQGYDCCSAGQCVNDLQLKDGATSDPDYADAVEEIMENPMAVYDYPHLYHICTVAPDKPPEPDPDFDSEEDALLRFIDKQELYQCTHPVKGEMSICTITYEDVSSDGETEYDTGPDDRDFTSTYSGTIGLPGHSLVEASYAGQTLFKLDVLDPPLSGFEIGPGNDNFTDPLTVTLTRSPASSAPNDTLKLRYMTDGSCERVNAFTARCQKYYTQGQNIGEITDHFPASNDFTLPFYADTNRTVQVQVDGELRLQGSDWQLIPSDPPVVEFIGSELRVFDSQEVLITFFVNTQSHNVLQAKEDALERIAEMCDCNDVPCGLKPKKNGSGDIEDYVCDYPDPIVPEPPQQQVVLLDSKSTPHRYFDDTGLYRSQITADTPAQEGQRFKYENNDLLKPNNLEEYIGFNEIYGSYGLGTNSALPAREVAVKPGKTYDIYTDSGSFNSCHFCGTDYYSNLARIYPNTFQNPGGGYTPNPTASSKLNPGAKRADDLIFGRACFIPATMIPWTHNPLSSTQEQRLRRLESQHFLFANGYQRDWYGFDYGSVIGSFDGVNWFSIGSERRVQAKTNKLFLAINAYFGDLTNKSTFQVTVNESTSSSLSGGSISDDHHSDGAQCRQYHVCESDSDCASQLGWGYSCENISGVRTKWPRFDINAKEIPGQVYEDRLTSIFNINAGGTKRCVYRGSGAPCIPDYHMAASTSSYSRTEEVGLHACTVNNHCQRINEGVAQEKFNNRISRFGKSVRHQNASSEIDEDTLNEFGLDSRIIGRPLKYLGDEAIQPQAGQGLASNNVVALCRPGRDPSSSNLLNAHKNQPGIGHLGDKVNAQGMTYLTGSAQRFKNSCPLFNHNENYLYKSLSATTSLGDGILTQAAQRQSISTNALHIFESEGFIGQRLLKNFENEFIENISYQESRCLRAPGSTCHTDMDCAPNKYIASQTNNIVYDEQIDYDILNRYEVEFWQQDLICSQEFDPGEEDFDLRNNRCCRETGRNLTVGTYINQQSWPESQWDLDYPNFSPDQYAGIDFSYSDSRRHSRNSTVADLLNSNNHPKLESARRGQCNRPGGCKDFTEVENQWRTLSAMNERTCCSGHWVRKFHPENGGGHNWNSSKHQSIPKQGFRCFNWNQCISPSSQCPSGSQFTCQHTDSPDDPNCLARATSISQARPIFEYMGKLELLGIPQIALASEDNPATQCSVEFNNQQANGTTGITSPEGDPLVRLGFGEFSDDRNAYVAHDMNNFDESLKPIFSSDEFSCCLPAGTLLDEGENPNQCCTGFINQQTGRCALPDYTNVSVYFNRYVSSEAKNLNDGLFNSETGYFNSPSTVEQLACLQNVCASGVLARGVSLSNLKIPGHDQEGQTYQIRRFIDSNTPASNFRGQADLYDEGLRWNEHVYCVPQELIEVAADSLDLISCGAF